MYNIHKIIQIYVFIFIYTDDKSLCYPIMQPFLTVEPTIYQSCLWREINYTLTWFIGVLSQLLWLAPLW